MLNAPRGLLRRLPIRARIALFGTAVVLLAVLLFGALVDVLFERSLYAQQDQLLQRRTQQVAQPLEGRAVRLGGFPRGFEGQKTQLPVDLRTSSDTFTEFLDPTGAVIFSTGEVDGRAPRLGADLVDRATRDGAVLTTINDSGVALRVSLRQIPEGRIPVPPTGPRPTFIAAGQSAVANVAQVNLLRLYLLLGALLSLAGALAASWVVAGRALRPLDTMTETVEAIGSAQDLGRRLPPAPAQDEVGRLTGAFNAMMGRIDEAYGRLEGALESQRRFVADASHELRTPLTSIRSNLGLLLGRADISAGDRAEALEDMDTEAQRMSRLVADLLTLARADAGQRLEMTAVDLHQVSEEVVRQARRTYPARRFELERKRSPRVSGNGDSLRQLLWILIDNAARHAGSGGRVHVTVDAGSAAATLGVGDNGPGIAPADRERIFERFYRADHARSGGGAGLGLSIARWIVEQHGGQIHAAANPQGKGALFTVDLPLAPGSEVRNVA